MKGRLVLAAAAVGSLAVAGCSSSSSSSSSAAGGGTSSASAATKSCVASVGFEGPITGTVAPLGTEQLHFAQLAVLTDNLANKTRIKLVQGDTQLQPAQATTVTQQFIANSGIVAVVGPAGSQEVEAVGGPMARAGMGVHHRVRDRGGADDREVPDVLPGRVQGQRAGPAGRELHREDAAPEGADDRR